MGLDRPQGALADLRVVRALRRSRSVLHLTNHHLARYGPLAGRPYILTVHDIIRWRDLTGTDCLISRPNRRDAAGLRRDYAAFGSATRIIAVSDFTRRDLIHDLHIPPERIRVIYEGVDTLHFRPTGRRPVPEPYLLFVGSEHPRKDLVQLLRALAELKRTERFEDLKLVKVGSPGAPESDFRRQTMAAVNDLGLQADVVFTGHVEDEDLPAYYSHAECFVLPSRYEGFGFPPLEAMACGCPVIVSTAGSLPEITGGAAMTVDPDDARQLSTALLDVLTQPGRRAAMSRKGMVRARELNWDTAATQTLALYEEVAGTVGVPSTARDQLDTAPG
jgi:glycosyltransferase involved in cell wall biosynthesis